MEGHQIWGGLASLRLVDAAVTLAHADERTQQPNPAITT
jgi:hypothetical protein